MHTADVTASPAQVVIENVVLGGKPRPAQGKAKRALVL